jgi:hypothetical protein
MAIRFFVVEQSRSRGYGLCGTHNYRGLFTLGNLHKGRSALVNFFCRFAAGSPWIQKIEEVKDRLGHG